MPTKNLMLLGVLLCLGGCMTPMQKRVDAEVKRNDARATADLATILENEEGYFEQVDDVWLSGDAIEIDEDRNEAPAFLKMPVRLAPQFPISLQKFAELIVQGYGVRVDVMADATDIASKSVDPTAGLRMEEGAAIQGQQVGSFYLDYKDGDLAGVLDHVTARVGVSWRVVGATIQIYYRDTRTWEVNSIPTASGIQNRVSNANGGSTGSGAEGGASATSSQSISTTATLDVFATIAEALKTSLAVGDTYVTSPALGTVTVTATPATLDRVEAFIEEANERMTRQVAIEAKLIAVRMSNGSHYGIDWNLMYRKLGSYGINATSFGDTDIDQNNMSISVIDTSSRLNGTSAIINALNSQGDVTVGNTVPAVTMSSRPVTVQFTDSFPYISRIQTQLVADAGSQTTIETSSIVTGLAVHLLPVITDKQDILLQLQASLSDITEIRQVSVPGGDQALEVPAVASRDITQHVRLRPGQTLVVSGFEQSTHARNSRGIGSANAWAAGGSADADQERVVLVLLVTTKIL